jgi:histidinol-phosphatase
MSTGPDRTDALPADLAADLGLALELAEAADAFTLPRYESRSLRVDRKDDRTEVTEADRGAETLLVERLLAARPEHAVFGEEHGLQGSPDATWRWVIDPIDGTSGFVRGIPVWGTLIALTRTVDGTDGGVMEAVLGVVSAPALGRRWWAARGLGTFADGRACQVSTVDRLEDAQVCVTFNDGWDRLGLTDELVRLQRTAHRARGFGDFWQHCLVAEGAVDVAIDAVGVAAYDIAAVSVIVEEAGGRFTDRHGERRLDTGTAISSNGLLHDPALARLS